MVACDALVDAGDRVAGEHDAVVAFAGLVDRGAGTVGEVAAAEHVNEIGGGSQGTNFTPEPSKPLAWSTEQGCSPSASMWTILFGVLADPQDRAYAYTTHGRYQLRTAVIPRRLRATGVAAYVAPPEQPIRILVTTARGGHSDEWTGCGIRN